MKNKNIVVKSNTLIEAQYKLPVLAQRVLLGCAMKVKSTDDFENTMYRLSVDEYEKYFCIDSNSTYGELRSAVDKIWNSYFVVIDDDGVPIEKRWIISRKKDKKSDYVGMVFHKDIKEFIFQLKNRFTSYNIENISHLKSSYSIRIYELLKQYENIGWRIIEYKTLRKILAIKNNEYILFGDFNRRVLKQSQKEIKANSDIIFEYRYIKDGRKVNSIRFDIHKQHIKCNRQLQSSNNEQKHTPNKKQPDIKPEPPLNIDKDLYDKLINHGLKRNQIIAFLNDKEIGVTGIKEGFEYFMKKFIDGKVDDPAVYLFLSIKEGYGKKTPEEIAKEKKQKEIESARITIKENKLILDELDREKSTYLDKKTNEIIKSLVPVVRDGLEKECVAQLSDFEKKIYNPLNKLKPMKFKSFIRERFVNDTDEEILDKVAKEKKVDIVEVNRLIEEAQEVLRGYGARE